MKTSLIKFLLITIMSALCMNIGIAIGAELPELKTEYSATRISDENASKMRSVKVYAAKDKERIETEIQLKNPKTGKVETRSSITITRKDKNTLWVLNPDQKTYMEYTLPAPPANAAPSTAEKPAIEKGGKEKIGAYETTKYTIIPPKNSKGGALQIWMTDNGIPVRTTRESKTYNSKGKVTDTRAIKTELVGINTGKQDPSLFEIPKNYKEAPRSLAYPPTQMPGSGAPPQPPTGVRPPDGTKQPPMPPSKPPKKK